MSVAGLGACVPFGVHGEVGDVAEVAEDVDVVELDQASPPPLQTDEVALLLLSKADGLLNWEV